MHRDAERFRAETKMIQEYQRRDGRNYRIVRIEGEDDCGRPAKITMTRFHAKDDREALAFLRDYRRAANRKWTYYFEKWRPHCEVINGRVVEFDGMLEGWRAKAAAETPWYAKAWDAIAEFFVHWFYDKPRDLHYKRRDMRYYAKYRQHYGASWDLQHYILKTLAWNIPILMKNKSGLDARILERATRKLHENEEGFDYQKYIESRNYSWTEEEEKLALLMQGKAMADLLDAVRTYFYYLDGGHGDLDPMIGIDDETAARLRKTLPIVPGTYDTLDWKRMQKMIDSAWNRVWDLMKKNGSLLWD